MSIVSLELVENVRAHNYLYSCQRILKFLLARVKSANFDPALVEALSASSTAKFKVPISALVADSDTEEKRVIEWFISTYKKNPRETTTAMAFALASPEFSNYLLDPDSNLVPTFVDLEQDGFVVGLAIAGTAPTPRAYFSNLLKDSTKDFDKGNP